MDRQEPERLKDLYDIAFEIYELGKSQKQVAKDLGVVSSTISERIKRAERLGIIEHVLRPPEDLYIHLEKQLIEKYRLKFAKVVRSSEDELNLIDRLGKAGAEYLEPRIKNNSKFGLASGRTLSHFVRHLKPQERITHLEIFGLSWCTYEAIEHSNTMLVGTAVMNLQPKGRGVEGTHIRGHGISIPGFSIKDCDTPAKVRAKRNALLAGFMDIDEMIERIKQEVSLMVIGIGAASPDKNPVMRAAQSFGAESYEELEKLGHKGSVLYRIYDASGCEIECKFNAQITGLAIEDLASASAQGREVIAIAGGPYKAESILAALKAEQPFIRTLITDEEVADFLIRDASMS